MSPNASAKARAYRLDVTDAAETAAVFRRAADWMGGLDLLAANAGISTMNPVVDLTEEEWDANMAVNAKGVFLSNREAVRHFLAAGAGGAIVAPRIDARLHEPRPNRDEDTRLKQAGRPVLEAGPGVTDTGLTEPDRLPTSRRARTSTAIRPVMSWRFARRIRPASCSGARRTMTVRFEPTRAIDIAALLDGGDAATDRAVAEVLASHGGAVVTGFAGAGDLDGRMAEALAFFRMEREAKLSCAVRRYAPGHANLYRGFHPSWEAPGSPRKESFDIGPEPPLTSPDVPGAESFREANVWPGRDPVPGWRDTMLDLQRLLRDLAVTLMASVARGLGLAEERLLAPARGRNATLRLLRYTAPGGPDRGEIGEIGDGRRAVAEAHVDTGLLSTIWQDAAGGLQLRGPDGVWREAPVVAGGLSLHCGDLMAALTGGRLAGTLHRAVARNGERHSVGFFLEPDFETGVVAPRGGAAVSYARHLVNEFPGRFEAPKAA